MGKTYKSFERGERLDYHDHELEHLRKKSKEHQIKHFVNSHKDRKKEQLDSLPGSTSVDDYRYNE